MDTTPHPHHHHHTQTHIYTLDLYTCVSIHIPQSTSVAEGKCCCGLSGAQCSKKNRRGGAQVFKKKKKSCCSEKKTLQIVLKILISHSGEEKKKRTQEKRTLYWVDTPMTKTCTVWLWFRKIKQKFLLTNSTALFLQQKTH